MIRNALLIGASMLALTLAGCDIYFGPTTGSDCAEWGCDQEPSWPGEPPPDPGTPGGACQSNTDCAPGCFCDDNNTCAESGFCEADWDCPVDFTCEDERATCVPGSDSEPPPPPACENDSQCPGGSYCDLATATCVPSWGCMTNEECGPGWECNAEGTCVPVSCDQDADCFEGCACQTDSGQCVETGFCDENTPCPDWCDAAGNCTPMECDPARNTCTWPQSEPEPEPDPASCAGPLTCSVAAPACADGETPAILDGCYTGECIPLAECDVAPLARCERIENPNQCLSRPDCEPFYVGRDCYCDGAPCVCSDPSMDCTCTEWEYSCASI